MSSQNKPKTGHITVIGNVGIDTNVYFPQGEPDLSIESTFTENLDTVGQAGGYCSRGFAALGYHTKFIGSVGDDHTGREIETVLRDDGVDIEGLFVDPAGTSRSINLMYADGRRKNFYDGKGHMQLKPDLEFCRRLLAGCRLAHFHLPNWARHLLPLARQCGAVLSCDLQDIPAGDDPYRRDFIEHSDIIFFSAATLADPEAFMRETFDRFPDKVLVGGRGELGVVLAHAGSIRYFDSVSLPQPVVDSNGAGDSLAVGFLSSHIFAGYDLEASLLRGQIAARYACTLKGTSNGLITKSELDELHLRLGTDD